ncbi:CRISPR-associated endonuclease Cas1 [Azospirillaceae bacterium]
MTLLKGRLGLETARIPHQDRHGLMWLARGRLEVENGSLSFQCAGSPEIEAGAYAIPFQTVSLILLGPGSTVSHDALRLMSRHGVGWLAVGEDGVRAYTVPPLGSNDSELARRQARVWADADGARLSIARRMYAWRLGEIFPRADISVLRGMEGARMKETYRLLAQKHGVSWSGRLYDRSNPESADPANQAINHAATAVEAAAAVAVAAVSAIPQLGFIHEASSNAFVLDVADMFRDEITLPIAFQAVRHAQQNLDMPLERCVRRLAGQIFRKKKLIDSMIDRIQEMFDVNDRDRHA